MKKLSSITTQIYRIISKSSKLTKIALCFLVAEVIAIIALIYTTNHPHLLADTDKLPLTTQTYLEVGKVKQIGPAFNSYLLDDTVMYNKSDDVFVVNGKTYVSAVSASNPKYVEEHYVNPILLLTSDLDAPDYIFDLCPEPTKILDKVYLASGECYDIEYWTYVIDYSSINPEIPTMILPVTTCVFWVDEQERFVFNFTTQSPYNYSELLTLIEDNTADVYQMSSDMQATYSELLKDINLFFKHYWNFSRYTNASL